MNNAPHYSTLRAIMRAYTDTPETPTSQTEHVREVATAILAQTNLDVPNLFFSKDKERDVREGLDEFIIKVTESDQPPNGEIKLQAAILNQKVYKAHHATAADERDSILEKCEKRRRKLKDELQHMDNYTNSTNAILALNDDEFEQVVAFSNGVYTAKELPGKLADIAIRILKQRSDYCMITLNWISKEWEERKGKMEGK